MQLHIKPRFCLILIAFMLIVFTVSIGISCHELRTGAERLAKVDAEYETMLLQLDALREELAFAGTDEYVERVARDELNMLMPGEVRYVSSR